jgi:hypothetical protein
VNRPEQFVPPALVSAPAPKFFLRISLVIALALAFASPIFAQRGSASAGHGVSLVRGGVPPFAGGRSFASNRGGRGFGRYDRYASPYLSLPFPFFDDAVDSGDIYSTGYPVAAALPPFLPTRGGRSFGADSDVENSPSSQPLMIELQNGRYVRVSNVAIDGEALPINSASNDANSADQANRPQGPAIAALPAKNMAPVILVFRDGHSEQVRDYTIANGTLYARGDFYTDGYWNKNIDLTGLNVAQTLQANSEHGVKFVLPSAPNEVITRP